MLIPSKCQCMRFSNALLTNRPPWGVNLAFPIVATRSLPALIVHAWIIAFCFTNKTPINLIHIHNTINCFPWVGHTKHVLLHWLTESRSQTGIHIPNWSVWEWDCFMTGPNILLEPQNDFFFFFLRGRAFLTELEIYTSRLEDIRRGQS